MTEKAQKLLELLNAGPMSIWSWRSLSFSNTELYHAIQELRQTGISVERIDAGGNPTWGIKQ